MTDFQAKCLKLWDQGNDTLKITETLRTSHPYPLHESAVYRALNAARIERRLYAESDAS